MNGNKSEPLTRDESEGDRCRRDTSDLQRMCASHSRMATGGDKPVGVSRSESAKRKKKKKESQVFTLLTLSSFAIYNFFLSPLKF